MNYDQSRWPNFSVAEMKCKATGELEMDENFMDKLQALRLKYGKAMHVTSGYRSKQHPNEINKAKGGWHTLGMAVDIRCHSDVAWDIVAEAMRLGFHGIGVSQKNGLPRFIHLDGRPFEQRALYSY